MRWLGSRRLSCLRQKATMNGIHDMGGMQDMGPIQYEKGEPVFHAPWESRVFAMFLAASAWHKWNLDAFRHTREVLPPGRLFARKLLRAMVLGIARVVGSEGLG